MVGRPSPQNPLISQLTLPPETITSCYPGIRHSEFQPHSGRHRISNENFLCACDRCNPDAVSDACACRYDLPVAAMSRVRRHRLHPDSGAMRDSGAIPSPQAIVAGSEAADILLLSIVPATVAIIAPATVDSDAVTRSDASGRNDGWCRCTSISVYS